MSFKNSKEVLISALEEFSNNYYDDASLNTIINKSGISKGSFYHHFKNKYDIYLYVLKDSIAKKWEFINENYNKEISRDIFELLQTQINIGFEFANKYPAYSSLYSRFINEKNKDIYSKAIIDLGINGKNEFDQLLDNAFKDNQFNEIYPKEFIKNIMNFFLQSYNKLALDSYDNKILIEFLKNGLGH